MSNATVNKQNSWRNSVINLRSTVAFQVMHLNPIMTIIIHENIRTQNVIVNHSYQRRQLFIVKGGGQKEKENSQRKAITLIQLWWLRVIFLSAENTLIQLLIFCGQTQAQHWTWKINSFVMYDFICCWRQQLKSDQTISLMWYLE